MQTPVFAELVVPALCAGSGADRRSCGAVIALPLVVWRANAPSFCFRRKTSRFRSEIRVFCKNCKCVPNILRRFPLLVAVSEPCHRSACRRRFRRTAPELQLSPSVRNAIAKKCVPCVRRRMFAAKNHICTVKMQGNYKTNEYCLNTFQSRPAQTDTV